MPAQNAGRTPDHVCSSCVQSPLCLAGHHSFPLPGATLTAAGTNAKVEAAVILKRELPPADAHFPLLSDGNGEARWNAISEQARPKKEFATIFSAKGLPVLLHRPDPREALAKGDRGPEAFDWLLRWLRDMLLIAVGAGGTISSISINRAGAHQ